MKFAAKTKDCRKVLSVLFLIMAFISSAQEEVFCEKGRATYYASKFEGRKCSSGEIFHQKSFTAAHATLKFGTRVKVTNLKNDSSVVVRINDRMPKRGPCDIDLALCAAKQLNFVKQGVARVKIEILKDSIP